MSGDLMDLLVIFMEMLAIKHDIYEWFVFSNPILPIQKKTETTVQ